MAAANKVSVGASVASILAELEGSFTQKEKQRVALQAFLCGQHISTLFPAGFAVVVLSS